jgi:uncharacterized protein YndB with AHSA1/START domain
MTTATETTVTTQVYRVYINAPALKVWDAITDPEWNGRYGYHARQEYDLRVGGSYRALATQEMREFGAPEVLIDGEILELDPPRRLVQTWHAYFDEATTAEPTTRLTWELHEGDAGSTELTVTHELTGAPSTASVVRGDGGPGGGGGGWAWIVSDLKTFLETGSAIGS